MYRRKPSVGSVFLSSLILLGGCSATDGSNGSRPIDNGPSAGGTQATTSCGSSGIRGGGTAGTAVGSGGFTSGGSSGPAGITGGGASGSAGMTGGGASGSAGTPSGGANTDASGNGPPPPLTRRACELVTGTEGPIGPLSLQVEEVVRGLEIPWGLAFMPNGDLLVTERPGRLRLVRGGQLQSTPVLDVDVADVPFELFSLGNEGGLLGVLLHPDFATNRLFYMYFMARKPDGSLINRLGLYEMSQDGGGAALVRFLLDDIPAGEHHQGGRMRIGPDGKLYVGVGAFDPGLAQQANQLPGKLLRLNPDGTVPDDNPTRGSYVFLTGVRNTQGFDWFDEHYLLVMDHGPTAIDPGVPEKGWDEFNVVRAGENLGWPGVRGCGTGAGFSAPVMVWQTSMPPGGAAVYTGTTIPEWKGSFLVGTLGLAGTGEGEHLHRIQVSADNPFVVSKHEVYLKGAYGRLRTVAMGPDGHVYLTTSNCDSRGQANGRCAREGGDKVLRIVGAH
jgi:aldose sugar dehydrogenase